MRSDKQSGSRPAGVWVAAALAVLMVGCGRAVSSDWTVYSNCTFVTREAYDGDSFHVLAGGKEYIFRLYFVDCPETDQQVPERVEEQAEVFRIGPSDVLRAGAEASRATRRALSEPFTVQTRFEDALGQSKMQRVFAFVTVKGRSLDELLTARGLARVYGCRRDLPDGTSWRVHLDRLYALEREARRRRLGAWSKSAPARLGASRAAAAARAGGGTPVEAKP